MTFPMSRGLLLAYCNHVRPMWPPQVEMTFPMSRGLLHDLGAEEEAYQDNEPVEMTFPMSRGLLPSIRTYHRFSDG